MGKIGNQQLLKEINTSLLLNAIFEHGPISRIDLARRTKLSPTTVSVLIEAAIRDGTVHEIGTFGTGVGRKMTLLNINADNGFVIGVDLSNSPFRIVLLNLQGKVVASHSFERLIGETNLKTHLGREIREFIDRQDIDAGSVRWIGVSVPGLIDGDGETVVGSSYLKVRRFPLKPMLAESLAAPIHLVNDLDAAGFAERFNGAAKDHRTIVYILIDYGVGAGLVIDNNIYRGVTGQAGRIAELYRCATDVLAESLAREYPDEFGDIGNSDDVVQSFVRLGLEGIAPFKQKLDELMQKISKYCGGVLQLLNPEQMIIGGWVTRNDALFTRLSEAIRQYEHALAQPTPVKASHWKEYGAAVGAATLGLHHIFKTVNVR